METNSKKTKFQISKPTTIITCQEKAVHNHLFSLTFISMPIINLNTS
jgi:hypothetical protein